MMQTDYGDLSDTIKKFKNINLNPLIEGINSSEYASLKIISS